MTSTKNLLAETYRRAKRFGSTAAKRARGASGKRDTAEPPTTSVSDSTSAAPKAKTPTEPKIKTPVVPKIEVQASEPQLAVIVPAYNVDEYLTACVKSVISQSFTNWEMIIVDDGSPGRTGEIADQLAGTDERITVIHQENQGLGAARNTGIAASSAPFMTFIDSDDFIPAGAFEKMMTSLNATGSDVAIGAIDRFNSKRHWTPFWVELVHDEYRQSITAKDLPPVMWDVFACNKIFKRETWDKYVGKFPVGTLYEDQECTAKLFVNDARLDILPEIVYHWRHREDGQSITQQKSNIDDLKQRLKVAGDVQAIIESYDEAYRQYWYTKCLGEDLFYYYREVPRTGKEFFEALQTGTEQFYNSAPDESIAKMAPERRWLAYLVAFGSRDDVVAVLNAFDAYRTYYQVRENDGALTGIIPGLEQVFSRIPEPLLHVDPDQLLPQGVITRVDSDRYGALIIEGFGYIPNFDQQLTYSAELISDGRVIASTSNHVLNENPGHLTADPYTEHARSKFHVVFSPEALDQGLADLDKTESEVWDLVIRIDSGSHSWELTNPKRSVEGQACWPKPGNLTAHGIRFIVIGDPRIGTQLKFLKPRFEVESLSLTGEVLTLSFRQNLDNGLPNHNRFDMSRAVVRVRDGRSAHASTPVTKEDGSYRAILNIADLGGGSTDQIRDSLTVDVACGGNIAAPLAISVPLLAGVPNQNLIMPSASGFGYLQIERAVLATTVDSITVDRRSGALVFEGTYRADAEIIRTYAPSFALVGKTQTLRLTRLVWDQSNGRYEAAFDLSPGGVPIGNDVFILQSFLPTKQPRPATVWVGVSPALESTLPAERSPKDHSIRITAVGKSRSVQIQVSGPGDTKAQSSAYRMRALAGALFNDRSRIIDEGSVLFESFGGNTVSDSPKEIDHVLAEKHPEVRRYWSVRDLSVEVPDGAIPLVVGTEEWMRRLSTCKLLVNNNNFPHYFRKADGQRYLQTWHGTPLKQIGNDVPASNLSLRYRALMKKEAEQEWDLLLAQSEWAAQRLSSAFGTEAPVFSDGYPRNDALVDPQRVKAAAEKVRRRFAIDSDTSIVLYAPTWRDNVKDKSGRYSRIDFLGLPEASKELGDDFVILYRGHANSVFSEQKALPDRVIDVSTYEDVNDLISAADMMLTDYSSIMFDYVVTGKPIAFMAPDLSEYRDEVRGFYFDFETQAPGPILHKKSDAVEWIRSAKDLDFTITERYLQFVAQFAPSDDGNSGKRLLPMVERLLTDTGREL
ncbi:hypothetical protein GCM10009700_15630 [Brevibacterium sanguinis]|uniref:bifunctional glycosyltransferase/CDP-glycerol:glycerophosphate glycerophosphotransferase n=1 Tax=Brevibacterium sanguinis TaxID=232444 RepID=UPI0031D42ACE